MIEIGKETSSATAARPETAGATENSIEADQVVRTLIEEIAISGATEAKIDEIMISGEGIHRLRE